MGVATTPFRVLGVETFPFISAIPAPGSQTSFSSRRGHLLAAAYFQKDLSPAAWPVSFPTLHRSRERAEKWNGHRVSSAVATKLETAPESIEIAPRACDYKDVDTTVGTGLANLWFCPSVAMVSYLLWTKFPAPNPLVKRRLLD